MGNLLGGPKRSASEQSAKVLISDFEFKLGDMGLAKSFGSLTELAQTFAGTPLAMAPEMIAGGQYSHKADIWSLGTLLFHMLTGSHPFTGRNMQDLKKNLRTGAYKIPRHIHLSVECLDFMNSCLRLDSGQRKDWDELLAHPFLMIDDHPGSDNTMRPIHLLHGMKNANESLLMDARKSYNLFEVYQNLLLKNIEQQINSGDATHAKEEAPGFNPELYQNFQKLNHNDKMPYKIDNEPKHRQRNQQEQLKPEFCHPPTQIAHHQNADQRGTPQFGQEGKQDRFQETKPNYQFPHPKKTAINQAN